MKKSLQSKWDNRLTEIHVTRLNNMKPCIDTGNPSQFRHLLKKCKKEQLLEGTGEKHYWDRQIHGDRASQPTAPGATHQHHAHSARPLGCRYRTRGKPEIGGMVSSVRRNRSLNKPHRRRELTKITNENKVSPALIPLRLAIIEATAEQEVALRRDTVGPRLQRADPAAAQHGRVPLQAGLPFSPSSSGPWRRNRTFPPLTGVVELRH